MTDRVTHTQTDMDNFSDHRNFFSSESKMANIIQYRCDFLRLSFVIQIIIKKGLIFDFLRPSPVIQLIIKKALYPLEKLICEVRIGLKM